MKKMYYQIAVLVVSLLVTANLYAAATDAVATLRTLLPATLQKIPHQRSAQIAYCCRTNNDDIVMVSDHADELDITKKPKKNNYCLVRFPVGAILSRAPASRELLNIGANGPLQRLLEDWKLYKYSEKPGGLQGSELLQHSFYVHCAAPDVLQSKRFVDEKPFSTREAELFSLAALLHDVGKAGQKELFDIAASADADPDAPFGRRYKKVHCEHGLVKNINYGLDKQEHCTVGFDYLTGTKTYQMHDGSSFDFAKLFEEFELNKEEQSFVAILVGIHYRFGEFREGKITAKQHVNYLQELVNQTGYNGGVVNEKLLHFSILIQVADVMGLHPYHKPSTPLFDSIDELPATRTLCVPSPSDQLKYNEEYDSQPDSAVSTMHRLMDRFKTERE